MSARGGWGFHQPFQTSSTSTVPPRRPITFGVAMWMKGSKARENSEGFGANGGLGCFGRFSSVSRLLLHFGKPTYGWYGNEKCGPFLKICSVWMMAIFQPIMLMLVYWSASSHAKKSNGVILSPTHCWTLKHDDLENRNFRLKPGCND